MLYSFTNQHQIKPLPTTEGLTIQETTDPILMADIGEISLEEAETRFLDGHKAFVAYLNNSPAAFGWLATKKARIGELNHEFSLPENHTYLWNFRTLAAFRGKGIYPCLLQYILNWGGAQVKCFWIMHAPENKASQHGIQKAGFTFIGKVSVLNGTEVIFTNEDQNIQLEDILETFGFKKTDAPQASCWNCSSPYLKNRKPECCCSQQETICTQNIFNRG